MLYVVGSHHSSIELEGDALAMTLIIFRLIYIPNARKLLEECLVRLSACLKSEKRLES